jgi:hypothetical protein
MQMDQDLHHRSARKTTDPIRRYADFVGKLESRLETFTLRMPIIPTSHPAYPPVGVWWAVENLDG